MAMESFATPYPVIFFDGEQEHDKGQIGVHSVITFKRFQALLSQKTGLPANQLSAVFVCRRTIRDTEKRQKLPINENTNFNIILNQHNPSREKGCHFLVSMKKSKKERKGITRKRITESENGDDDESVSPSSHSSRDERSKADGSADGESSPEASSPIGQDHQSFAVGLIGSNQNSQRHYGVALSGGKSIGAEKILLRREMGMGVSPGSLREGWKNGCRNERHEDARPSGSLILESNVVRLGSLSTRQQLDTRPSEKQKIQDENGDHRLVEKMMPSMQLGEPLQLHSFPSRADVFQERRNDTVITSPVRSTVLLPRNGILTPPGAACATPFSTTTNLSPLVYPSLVGTGMVRVPSASSGGVAAGSNAARNLQQAQAHYLSLQKQHPVQMHMSSQAITKMKGVVRGLASFDSGSYQSSGVCIYCCSYKEQNINPMPFHLCVQDRVTMGFRGPSPAGPIERPVKRLEAAA